MDESNVEYNIESKIKKIVTEEVQRVLFEEKEKKKKRTPKPIVEVEKEKKRRGPKPRYLTDEEKHLAKKESMKRCYLKNIEKRRQIELQKYYERKGEEMPLEKKKKGRPRKEVQTIQPSIAAC